MGVKPQLWPIRQIRFSLLLLSVGKIDLVLQIPRQDSFDNGRPRCFSTPMTPCSRSEKHDASCARQRSHAISRPATLSVLLQKRIFPLIDWLLQRNHLSAVAARRQSGARAAAHQTCGEVQLSMPAHCESSERETHGDDGACFVLLASERKSERHPWMLADSMSQCSVTIDHL
jgi:hypothetical protein